MGHAYLKLVKKLMTSSIFFVSWCLKLFNWIKLKLRLEVDFGALSSILNSKIGLNVKIWREKASFLWFWSRTVSENGHHWNKKTSVLKLLVLKNSLYICTKFCNDWLNGFWVTEEKPGNRPFCPSPIQIGLKAIFRTEINIESLYLGQNTCKIWFRNSK